MISEEFEKTRPRCGTCVHYSVRRNGGGECRAHPPQVGRVMKPVPRGGPQAKFLGSALSVGPQAIDLVDDANSFFPPMRPDLWCGEHPDFHTWHQSVRSGGSDAAIPYYTVPPEEAA